MPIFVVVGYVFLITHLKGAMRAGTKHQLFLNSKRKIAFSISNK